MVEIVHQHPPSRDVVVENGKGIGQLLIIAVHENQGNALLQQGLVEPDVRVGEPGFCSFYKDPVQLFHPQQGRQDPALAGKLVLCGKQERSTVVF